VVTLTWDYDEFNDDPSCGTVISPQSFGYIAEYDASVFSFDIDLVSLTSAVAVNAGILDFSYLEVAGAPLPVGLFNGMKLSLQQLIDPRFPRMQPIVCFQLGAQTGTDDDDDYNDDDYHVTLIGSDQEMKNLIGKCMIRAASDILLPAFNMYENSCQTCDTPIADRKEGCNAFDLMLSLVVYESTTELIKALVQYDDYKVLNDQIQQAARHAVYGSGTAAAADDDTRSVFSFCGTTTCAVTTVNVYDEVNKAVSPYYFNLDEGHCVDSTQRKAFLKLAEDAPQKLVEEYYRCRKSVSTSFFDSVGIANGNTAVFAPLVGLFILTPLIHAYYMSNGKVMSKAKYSDKDMDSALKELAERLLDIKNGKPTLQSDSVIVQLTADLSQLATEDREKR
jgi:hypothetical protein